MPDSSQDAIGLLGPPLLRAGGGGSTRSALVRVGHASPPRSRLSPRGGQAVVARAANGRSAVRVSGDVEELPGGAGRYRAFLRRHRRGRARPAAAGA